MLSGPLPELGAVAGGVGAVLVLLAGRRAVLLAGLVLLAAAEALLVTALARDAASLPGGTTVAALAVGGAIVVALVGVVLVRLPALAPLVLLAVAPFRIPVDVGDEDAFLLIPLYLVLAGAGAALAVRALRGEPVTPVRLALAVPMGAFVALAAASMLWAHDLQGAAVQLAFFLLPFSALVAVVARSPVVPDTARRLAVTLFALACGLALVGLWQVQSGELFFAPDVEVSNEYTSYERVTSLFKDPGIYGRHLAVAMVVVVVALWAGTVGLVAGAALLALLWAGLFYSYSQSSMVALSVAVVLVSMAFMRARLRRVVIAVALAATVVVAGVVAVVARDEPVRRLTSGRSDIAVSTAEVIADNLPLGVGIGSEREATRLRAEERGDAVRSVSHTTPLTVAAELGIPGVLLYLALLAGGAWTLLAACRRRRSFGLALVGVALVIFIHSLFYSGFFEDPILWGALALASVLAATRETR
jgi:uncharacterized membrane protein